MLGKSCGMYRLAGALLACLWMLGMSQLAWAQKSATTGAVSPAQVVNPRTNHEWVSDGAGIFSSAVRARINQKLTRLERETGVEVALVTVNAVSSATPKDFATELFNRWKIGKRSSNNGLLILMVMQSRRLEMETGYGLEGALSDGWLKRMQTSRMVPRFKDGKYEAGLEDGVDAIISRLHQKPDELALSEGTGSAPEDAGVPWWAWALGLGGVGTASGFGFRRYRYKKERTCPHCHTFMQMLSEEEDDAFLDGGQVAEEQLGSVDYQYYYCTPCNFNKIIRVNKWFSGFSECPECKYRTMSETTTTITAATQYSSGLSQTYQNCSHCKYDHTFTTTIPQLPPPSSSSSSSGGYSGGGGGGGGSFGGGSSGGGGAGSSW